MKKKLLIGKIIGFVGLLIFTTGVSYMITYYLDRSLYSNIDLLVTMEDTETFTISNTNKLDDELVLETYPYIFEVKNKNEKTNFNILLLDNNLENVERSNLNYILYKNDELVKKGVLSEIKNNILYNASISKKATDTYKLFVYVNEELEDVSYEYSIKIEAL